MADPFFPGKDSNPFSYIWHASQPRSPETTPYFPVAFELQTEETLFRIRFFDRPGKRNGMAKATPEESEIEVLSIFWRQAPDARHR
jgi:hypothetical protein